MICTCDLDVVLPDQICLGDPLVGHFEYKWLQAFVLSVCIGAILIMTCHSAFTERGQQH